MSRIGKSVISAALAAGLCATVSASAAKAQNLQADRYVFCSFRPQAASCQAVYQQALRDQSPGASAVKAAFDGYGRYVAHATGSLTEADKQFLTTNAVRLPELTPQDQAGLHAVINDPALAKDADARRIAVNNFISRAVQAEQYCNFNDCNLGELIAAASPPQTRSKEFLAGFSQSGSLEASRLLSSS